MPSEAAKFGEVVPSVDNHTEQRAAEQPKVRDVDTNNVAEIAKWQAHVNRVRRQAPAETRTEAPNPAKQLEKMQAQYAENYATWQEETDPADKASMAANLHRLNDKIQALKTQVDQGAEVYRFPTGEKITAEETVAGAESRLAQAQEVAAAKQQELRKRDLAVGLSFTELKAAEDFIKKPVAEAQQNLKEAGLKANAALAAGQLENMVAGLAAQKSPEELAYMIRSADAVQKLFAMQGGKLEHPDGGGFSSEEIEAAVNTLRAKYQK